MGGDTTCMGSVDFFHYENGNLKCHWLGLDPTFASMGQPSAFYQGTQKLQEASSTTLHCNGC